MIDLYLSAPDEATLAAALPALREPDTAGIEHWLASGLFHALDAGFAIVLTPAEIDPDGTVTRPAVLAPGYHANLRLLGGYPDRDALLAAVTPYRTEPATPQRVFAGEAADLPVPESATNADWRVGLILWGRFAEVEAAVTAARDAGTVPGLIAWQRWEYANHVLRAELMAMRETFGFSAENVDESLRRAATIPASMAVEGS